MALEERVGQVLLAVGPESLPTAAGAIIVPDAPVVDRPFFRRADLSTGLGLSAPPVYKSG